MHCSSFEVFRFSFATMLLVLFIGSSSVFSQVSEPAIQAGDSPQLWCEYVGTDGPGQGKHIVLIAGDDEYRSEEAMPMLGKILAKRYGFRCSVLFPIDPETGKIKPDYQTNIPGMHLLDSADLVILGLRFRHLPDEQMKHFADYLAAGKPFIGTRTSTHAFHYQDDQQSPYRKFSYNNAYWRGGFGQQVLGDTWISHHGNHKSQSTRGVVVDRFKDSPILNGVSNVWGPSDVYGIRNLPEDARVLLQGQVLDGMTPESKPVTGKQNDPMMPLAWTRLYESGSETGESGTVNRVFCTTMGAATDFACEDLRRLIVNACFWCLDQESAIPEKGNVDYVDPYQPTEFGFGSYQKDLRPADFNMK